jgi:hypothetical protein
LFAQDVGCFGLTELGYGNNAVEMETTAIYDVDKKGSPSLIGLCYLNNCLEQVLFVTVRFRSFVFIEPGFSNVMLD